MNNGISHINRNFDDYRKALKEYIAQYYPNIANDFDDASVGSWFVDLVASVSDNLSYYIDKAYNETSVDSAQQRGSLLNLARTNGLKVPGPKGAVALCEFSCYLPVQGGAQGMPNYDYAPIIKRGMKVSARSQIFETINDINFKEEYDFNGFPNRNVIPITDGNDRIIKYIVTKREVVSAGESRIYKQVFNNASDIYPFMEVVIPDTDVMNVESIIFKTGVNYQSDPDMWEFTQDLDGCSGEGNGVRLWRFFEVDSLADHYRWGDAPGESIIARGERQEYTCNACDQSGNPTYFIAKGEWKPVFQKFITEFTDNGYMKVIFGGGGGYDDDIRKNADNFTAYQISKMVRNDFLGVLPPNNSTMYILYRAGGGAASNVATGAIDTVVYSDVKFINQGTLDRTYMAAVRKSISVKNVYPSITGKDAPSVDEIRAMIKYNNASLGRCVTLKDYVNRILMMPPRYGCPFRVSGVEENNKIMLYMLGINSDGTLSDSLPEQLVKNMENYLAMYRSVNDFVEMKVGRIVNISVEADIIVCKDFNAGSVVEDVINAVRDYMSIDRHQLGESIYVSLLAKEITNIPGVLNLIDLRIFNNVGNIGDNKYSNAQTSDYLLDDETGESTGDGYSRQIDLEKSKYTLNSDADAMYEIKFPESDIRVRTMMG